MGTGLDTCCANKVCLLPGDTPARQHSASREAPSARAGDDVAAAQHRRALVVGLGGGCLPMYMRHILGLSVQVVELDPVVADLASHHFGFVADEQLLVSATLPSG